MKIVAFKTPLDERYDEVVFKSKILYPEELFGHYFRKDIVLKCNWFPFNCEQMLLIWPIQTITMTVAASMISMLSISNWLWKEDNCLLKNS